MSDLDAQLQDLLSQERGSVRLGGSLKTVLIKYLLETVEVQAVDEVPLVNLVRYAEDAWMDQKSEDLPSIWRDTITAWLTDGGWPGATVPPTPAVSTSAGIHAGLPGSATGVVAACLAFEDKELFGDAGASAREVAQLEGDKKAQDLTGVRLLVLSAALELGRVPPPGDILGELRYGGDPRLSKMTKDQRKAGLATLKTLLEGDEATRTNRVSQHLTGLVREYSERGQITEASLITTWWSEVQSVAHSPRVMTEYMNEYFKRYAGRGLPVTVDILIATRCSNAGAVSSTVSAEAIKETKEAAKAARSELRDVKSELKSEISSLKSEVNRLRQLVGNSGGGGGDKASKAAKAAKNVKCHNCGKKGHFARDCPEDEKEDEEGEEEDK